MNPIDDLQSDSSLSTRETALADGMLGESTIITENEAENISARALRESEERLRLALEAGRMGSWEWRISTNEVIWSPGLEAIHGIPEGSFPGTFEAYQDDMHPHDRERVLACISHTLNDGVDHEVQYRLVLPDGRIRWVEGRGRLFRDNEGKPERMIGVCVDITDRKEAEEALRNFAAEMSETDRRKDEFLAMLAHELRNPLAPIRNALEIMKMSSGGSAPLESAASMMERQVGQLVRLVDDLLDVSRISRGKIELRRQRVELASIIYQAVEVATPSCESGGVDLKVELPGSPIYIYGDSARLNQAIDNLLNNSCKFTNKGGRIDLIVTEEDGFAVIRVKDTGIGIDPGKLPFIFDLFVQADTSLERSSSGLGIGLTLVNNLVEMHGGTVTAHSEGLGHGSEFAIRIPVVAADAETLEPASVPETNIRVAGSLRILVVDDNVDSAESLALLLQFSGHHTAMAHDGQQAVETASSFEPDVILLDIGLPKLNGYEAARAIRNLENGHAIHLIALTGWGQQEDRTRSKEAGLDGHMVKPVDHVELAKQLKEISEAKNGAGQ